MADAIEFHCEHCGKHIRAPHDSGGKHGDCPACHQRVYIPMPPDELEPLDLSPVDEQSEKRQQELEEESRKLAKELISDRTTGSVDEDKPRPSAGPAAGDVANVDVERLVIDYAQKMAGGDLEGAERVKQQIQQHKSLAEDIIQRITNDELPPPELEEIPRPVLVGFLKQLRNG